MNKPRNLSALLACGLIRNMLKELARNANNTQRDGRTWEEREASQAGTQLDPNETHILPPSQLWLTWEDTQLGRKSPKTKRLARS